MTKINGIEVEQVVLTGKEFGRVSRLTETKSDAEAIFKNLVNLLRLKGVKMNIDYENLLNNKFDDATISYDEMERRFCLHIIKK